MLKVWTVKVLSPKPLYKKSAKNGVFFVAKAEGAHAHSCRVRESNGVLDGCILKGFFCTCRAMTAADSCPER